MALLIYGIIVVLIHSIEIGDKHMEKGSKKHPVIGALLFISSFLVGLVPRGDYELWRQLTRFEMYLIDAVRLILMVLGIVAVGGKGKKEMYITISLVVGVILIVGVYSFFNS